MNAEITWLHLLIAFAVVLAVTYPITLVLIAIGKIRVHPRSAPIDTANQIVKNQASFAFFAWMVCTCACFGLFIVWVLIGGVLVFLGAMNPVQELFNPTLVMLMLGIHAIGQGYAYVLAVRQQNRN